MIADDLRNSTFDTFGRIVDFCIDEGVDALLVAGDIFDSADRGLKAQLAFQKGLTHLHVAGVASFICHGNHDPLDGWFAKLDLPETCHRFGPGIESIPLDPSRPDDVVIIGVSY